MTFLLFILIVLFLIFGWPMLRVWLAVRNARNNVRNMFGGAGNTGGYRTTGNQRTQYDAPRRRPRRKIIEHNVGEYVEFEEIAQSDTTQNTTTEQRTTYTESQITDVEWEDIQ